MSPLRQALVQSIQHPDHGVDDFIVGQAYGLGTLNLVNDNGVYREQVELFAGQHVHKVEVNIIDTLVTADKLVFQSKIQHSFPHCWRTKTPLIFRATPQWFVSMTKNNLLQRCQEELDNVSWLPSWGKARITSMLGNSPDWCVSRQRTWGVPIPLFVHKETQELHPDSNALIEQVALRIEKEGIQAWFDLEPSDVLGEEAADYSKVSDTLDVWFDSGVTHESVVRANPELSFPADLYLEGSDQHRGWFQSSLKTSIAMNNCAPYKTVLTHGFTVDAQGHKMSKSQGNVIAPQKIFKSLGADILRLWVASSDFSSEMTVSDEILKRTADSYRRMRNTVRYLLSNLDSFEPATDLVADQDLLALDRWILHHTAQLQEQVRAHYEAYEFHQLYQLLHKFCSIELGGLYLDIIKDRVYTTVSDSLPRRSAQTAVYHISQALLRWLAPILSFTAEEAYAQLPGERSDSVFLQHWYQALPQLNSDDAISEQDWINIFNVRQAALKVLEGKREAGVIGANLNAAIAIFVPTDIEQSLTKLGDELRFIFITSEATVAGLDKAPTDCDVLTLADDIEIKVHAAASSHEKCVRCWHQRADVGSHTDHPELCGRCVSNVDGDGEQRLYA